MDRVRGIGRADLHLHTTYSDGLAEPAQLLDVVEALKLDVIAITDHDTVAGARAVQDLASESERRVQIITGIEVTTVRGMHLLGLFVQHAVKTYQSVEYSVEAIADQGGICLVPHPMSLLTPSLGRRSIERLLDAGMPLLAVEMANPSPAGKIVHRKVGLCNQRWGLAEFGGSDAHFLQHVGIAYTSFPGRTSADVRRALLEGTTAGHFTTDAVAWVPPSDYARQIHRSMIRSPARKVAKALREMRRAG